VLGDEQTLSNIFTDAAASIESITAHPGKANFPSIAVMIEADLRGWLPVMGVFLNDEQINPIMQEAEVVLGEYVTEEGRMVFDSSAHLVTAIKQ
jgi:hypothetical protein